MQACCNPQARNRGFIALSACHVNGKPVKIHDPVLAFRRRRIVEAKIKEGIQKLSPTQSTINDDQIVSRHVPAVVVERAGWSSLRVVTDE